MSPIHPVTWWDIIPFPLDPLDWHSNMLNSLQLKKKIESTSYLLPANKYPISFLSQQNPQEIHSLLVFHFFIYSSTHSHYLTKTLSTKVIISELHVVPGNGYLQSSQQSWYNSFLFETPLWCQTSLVFLLPLQSPSDSFAASSSPLSTC